jgi:hypothetical protein
MSAPDGAHDADDKLPSQNGRSSVDSHVEETGSSLHNLTREPTREEKVREAIDGGHDADIPSNIGFILDEEGEKKRRESIARRRRESDARRKSSSQDEAQSKQEKDVEQGPTTTDGTDLDTTSEDEANVIWWDGPDDPANPYNWSTWRKVMNCALISGLTFITPLASCK